MSHPLSLHKYLLEFVDNDGFGGRCSWQISPRVGGQHLMIMWAGESESCHESFGNVVLALFLFVPQDVSSTALNAYIKSLTTACRFMSVVNNSCTVWRNDNDFISVRVMTDILLAKSLPNCIVNFVNHVWHTCNTSEFAKPLSHFCLILGACTYNYVAFIWWPLVNTVREVRKT